MTPFHCCSEEKVWYCSDIRRKNCRWFWYGTFYTVYNSTWYTAVRSSTNRVKKVWNLRNLSAQKPFQTEDSIVLGGKADSPKTKSPKKLKNQSVKKSKPFSPSLLLVPWVRLSVLLPATRECPAAHTQRLGNTPHQHPRDRAFTLQPSRVLRRRLCREGRQATTSLRTQPPR